MAGADPLADQADPAERPSSLDEPALNALLAGVLAASRIGVVLVSTDGALRWLNPAAATLLGQAAGHRPEGPALRSFFTTDGGRHAALAHIEACLASGETLAEGIELQLQHSRRWLRLSMQPFGASRPSAPGIGGALALQDVTAERQRREEAGREGTLLREAARLGHIGAWDFDAVHEHVRWSDETYAIHDLPPGEAPGRDHALSFYDPASRQQFVAAMRQAVNLGTPFDLSLGLTSATGQAKRVRLIGSAERDESGRVTRVVGLIHDITEREQHAKALQDKATAERASRAKSEFLSRVSHELRTPLNGVLGFAQLLQQRAGELPPWTAEPLRLIRQAGDHLLTLIDDMLDLGSIEAGSARLDCGPVSLDAVVGESLRLMAPQALAAGVALRPWAPSGAWVHADATRLRQVLLNLLSNAIKYNRSGGDVQLRLEAGPGLWVLRVIDSGPGISAERRRALFQPFNRLGAEHGSVPGSGLGLTIARHLTEAMAGRLELAPPAGPGTELRVSLQQAEPADATAPPAAAPGLPAAPPPAADACHVLYVEDHPVNALLMSEALAVQQPRHRLRVAETGEQGLEMLAAEPPDIVLLDLNLPGADGYEVLARMRAEPAWAHLPCVAVSADAMPEELARARAAGFDDYWTKPLTMAGLADRIAALVTGLRRPGA